MQTVKAIELLAACKSVLAAIHASGQGVYYQPSEQEMQALKGFEEVTTGDEAKDAELWLEEVRRAAGLRPSDMGMLNGVLWQQYLHHPGMADDLIEAIKRQLE